VKPADALSLEDLLVVLIEECAEVTKASTKCLRFGFARDEPEYGRNDVSLSEEIGDLLGVIDELRRRGSLSEDAIIQKRVGKIAKVIRARETRS
jgi:hypothetical protein